MTITKEEVEKIAGLVKINLTEEAVLRFARDMGEMLALTENLISLDTEGVAPAVHAARLHTVLREDTVVKTVSREEILANAPERDETCFLTPKVVD